MNLCLDCWNTSGKRVNSTNQNESKTCWCSGGILSCLPVCPLLFFGASAPCLWTSHCCGQPLVVFLLHQRQPSGPTASAASANLHSPLLPASLWLSTTGTTPTNLYQYLNPGLTRQIVACYHTAPSSTSSLPACLCIDACTWPASVVIPQKTDPPSVPGVRLPVPVLPALWVLKEILPAIHIILRIALGSLVWTLTVLLYCTQITPHYLWPAFLQRPQQCWCGT